MLWGIKMNNIIGLILSLLLTGGVIFISTILQKAGYVGDEGARKFVHIGVSNWWIIAMIFFDNIWFAIIPPILFIALNYLSYKFSLIKAMEGGSRSNLGTVYYPISLAILILVTFNSHLLYIGALGILVLGYGDGMAAVIGTKFGKNKIIFNKSVQGSATMFIFSLVVSFIILSIFTPKIQYIGSLIIASFATTVELLTPYGLDNLSVPLGSSAVYYLLTLVVK